MREVIFYQFQSYSTCLKRRTYCILRYGEVCCQKQEYHLSKYKKEDNFFIYNIQFPDDIIFQAKNFEDVKNYLVKMAYDKLNINDNKSHLGICEIKLYLGTNNA